MKLSIRPVCQVFRARIMASLSIRALAKLAPVLLLSGLTAFSHAQAFTIAVPSSFETQPGITISNGNALQNDIYDGPVTVVLVSTTLHGTLNLPTDGVFSYVPDKNFVGEDRFEYELEDSTGNLSNVATDTIAVGAVNSDGFSQGTFIGPSSATNVNNFYVYLNYTTTAATTVSLKSSNPSLVSVPATLTVASGQYFNQTALTIKAVSANTLVGVSAELYGYTVTNTVYLVTPSPSAIYFSNNNPTGGDGSKVTGQVYIYGSAPSGGLVVDLTSSDTAAATVPATVTIPASANNVVFPITTHIVPTYRRVTVTASTPGGKISGQLNVLQFTFQFSVEGSTELFSYPNISPPAIVGGNDPSGEFNTATVTMTLSSTAPPGGLTLPLLYDSYVPGVTGPASITFPAGKTIETFKMSVKGYAAAETPMYVGSYYLDTTNYAGVNVYPPLPEISLDDDDYEFGGESFPVNISLLGFAPPGGATIALTSSSAYAPLPATVVIPAGQNEIEVNVKAPTTTAFQPATITASYSGYSSSTTFVVLSPQVEELVLSSYKVIGGASVTGTIYLDGVAPTGGTKVNLVGSPTGLVGPTSVTVPAGKSSVSFTLTTKAVTKATDVDIQAYTWHNTEWGDSEQILLEP